MPHASVLLVAAMCISLGSTQQGIVVVGTLVLNNQQHACYLHVTMAASKLASTISASAYHFESLAAPLSVGSRLPAGDLDRGERLSLEPLLDLPDGVSFPTSF